MTLRAAIYARYSFDMLAAGRIYQSALGKSRDTLGQKTLGPYKSRSSAIDKEAS